MENIAFHLQVYLLHKLLLEIVVIILNFLQVDLDQYGQVLFQEDF